MKKRILSVLLVLVMLMSLFPSSVIALGSETDLSAGRDLAETGVAENPFGSGAYVISKDTDLRVLISGTTVRIEDPYGAIEKETRLMVRELRGDDAAPYLAALEKSGAELENALVLDVSLVGPDMEERQPMNGFPVQLYFENPAYGTNSRVWHFEAPEPTRGAKGPSKAPSRGRHKGRRCLRRSGYGAPGTDG